MNILTILLLGFGVIVSEHSHSISSNVISFVIPHSCDKFLRDIRLIDSNTEMYCKLPNMPSFDIRFSFLSLTIFSYCGNSFSASPRSVSRIDSMSGLSVSYISLAISRDRLLSVAM